MITLLLENMAIILFFRYIQPEVSVGHVTQTT